MLTAHQRLIRRVAARWSLQQIQLAWVPPIPTEALARLAFLPTAPESQALTDARDSVSVFIPKLLQMLRKVQGEPYSMNASASRGRIFYYFAPKQPLDSFNMTLWVQGDKAHLAFSFVPHKLNGHLDFQRAISEKTTSEPEMAGLALMRLVRSVLATKARLKLGGLQ